MKPPPALHAALFLLGASVGLSAADWPGFLGPDQDGRIAETIDATKWPTSGLTTRWRYDVGEGFSGPAVLGDRVIISHRIGGSQHTDAVRVSDGSRLWRASHPTSYRDDFGFDEGPRATPALNADVAVTLSAAGIGRAIAMDDGATRWEVDFAKEFGAGKGFFGFAASPILVDDLALFTVGGRPNAGIVAVALDDGWIEWTAGNHEAGYAAPTLAEIQGESVVVFFTRDGLVARDPRTGEEAWTFPWRARMNASVNAATPLVWNDQVFVTSSYNAGAALVDPTASQPKTLWDGDSQLSCHYATPIRFGDHLYGADGRVDFRGSMSMRCVDWATGDVLWRKSLRTGVSIIGVGDSLLVLSDDGELQQWKATPEEPTILNRAQVLGAVARAAPAFSDGTLYARDSKRLVAVEIP